MEIVHDVSTSAKSNGIGKSESMIKQSRVCSVLSVEVGILPSCVNGGKAVTSCDEP